ncbi:MAG TPA: TolC family protein, partial [Thermoanaerobaculia bacterium]
MRRPALLLVFLLPLAGCATGPVYQRPAVSVPETLDGQNGPSAAASLGDLPWWEVFQDSALKSLIEEAQK